MRTLISRMPDDLAEDATLRELYVATSCLDEDAAGRAVPIDSRGWAKSFPHLAVLFERIAAEADWSRARWSRFETIRLKRWHAGRVALPGDAAHSDLPRALALWERRERPLSEHAQRWSTLYGHVTNWPEQLRSLARNALGSIGWMRRRYQRTANHIPTGDRSVK